MKSRIIGAVLLFVGALATFSLTTEDAEAYIFPCTNGPTCNNNGICAPVVVRFGNLTCSYPETYLSCRDCR